MCLGFEPRATGDEVWRRRLIHWVTTALKILGSLLFKIKATHLTQKIKPTDLVLEPHVQGLALVDCLARGQREGKDGPSRGSGDPVETMDSRNAPDLLHRPKHSGQYLNRENQGIFFTFYQSLSELLTRSVTKLGDLWDFGRPQVKLQSMLLPILWFHHRLGWVIWFSSPSRPWTSWRRCRATRRSWFVSACAWASSFAARRWSRSGWQRHFRPRRRQRGSREPLSGPWSQTSLRFRNRFYRMQPSKEYDLPKPIKRDSLNLELFSRRRWTTGLAQQSNTYEMLRSMCCMIIGVCQ